MPMGMAFDPSEGRLFIATAYGLVVTNGGTQVIDSIPASLSMQFPCNLVYVPTTHELFVANCGGDAVSAVTVIDPCTDRIVATIALSEQPFGIAYDSHTDQVFVADSSGTVSVIDVQALQVVQEITVPSGYYGVLFDSDTNEVYVSNADNNTVSVISDESYSIVATVDVGVFPMGMGLDATKGLVFVANFVNGTVSAIAEGNHSVVRTVNVGWLPSGVAVDPCTGTAYVSNGADYSVIELDTSTFAATPCMTVGSTLGIPLFVPELGQVFVPCVAAGEVMMFAG
jgi:YVTN family beta-propeller protein